MNILWFNWKDIKNPEAGGAEVFTHEVAKRLVANGYKVTLFTSRFNAIDDDDAIDGVKIIRKGNKYTVYDHAKKYYQNNDYYDLVIDEINTKPFLTPKYCKKPIIALIHQLARECWFYETKFPLNVLGYYLEYKWLRHYTDIDVIVPSNSTKEDLIKLGFKHVHLAPVGLNIKSLDHISEKESKPTLLFVGRLVKSKRPDDTIKVFKIVKKEMLDAQLWIVGDGYMYKDLKKYDDIKFFGRVTNEEKINLMKKAHILLMPSVREGWGLVVTEANALSTIVIGYDVPGLRDSIIDNVTGKLVKDVNEMAHACIQLLRDKEMYNLYANNALKFSRNFSWDNTTKEFLHIIDKIT